MIQVLLSIATPSHHPAPPITMWMPDSTKLGDIFTWGKNVCTVSSVYGTHLCTRGTECKLTDRPRKNRQAGVVLDRHPTASTNPSV